MSSIVTYMLLTFIVLYGLFITVEFIFFRKIKSYIVQILILFGVFVVLHLTTGFPEIRQAFGGVSPVLSIGVMFLCVVLGMAADSLFYLKGKFTWSSFLRPIIISPIVLLPLIGSVQGSPGVESIQLISFAFLAFQNGFFWKEVFQRAKNQV